MKKSIKKINIAGFSLLVVFAFLGYYNFSLGDSGKITLQVYEIYGNQYGGTVTASGGGKTLKCEFSESQEITSRCKGTFPKNSNITLTATPNSGYVFKNWNGACSVNSSTCALTNATQDKAVGVFFYKESSSVGPFDLTLKKEGTGTGVVEAEITKSDDGTTVYKTCYLRGESIECAYNDYPSGSSVKLTIAPDSGMDFEVNGGGCDKSNNTCSFSLDEDKEIFIKFTPTSDPAPKINFFYADPSNVKKNGTVALHGQARNTSKCYLMTRDDSSVGSLGYPPFIKERLTQSELLMTEPYYWRDVTEDFTWSTTLNQEGNYEYGLSCRGKGSYDNQFEGNGIVSSYITVNVRDYVTLSAQKSGSGSGTVKSDAYSASYAWHNEGLVPGGPRYTGICRSGYSYVKTYSCNSLTLGTKVYDGNNRGSSYGDTGDAFPVYTDLETSAAKEYTNSCSLGLRYDGTVYEWKCQDKVFDIECGLMCWHKYPFGENKKIKLTATPNPGSVFNKWSGVSCEEGTNTGSNCTVTMDDPKTVNADFTICSSCASSSSSSSGLTQFDYTGDSQTYTVPSGVSQIKITAYGAQGGGNGAGKGGMAQGVVTVTASETLYVYVGGRNGFNGGGESFGGRLNGGGASDVRRGGTALSNRIIVAGGGGGIGDESSKHPGGAGGLNGSDGNGTYPGRGANQTYGGAGGGGNIPGSSGSLGVGGSVGTTCTSRKEPCGNSGGGGGGYYGGGAGGDSWDGGDQSSGGGGGSSYISGSDTSTQSGVWLGDGQVIIQALF